jgi:hypothetical protein
MTIPTIEPTSLTAGDTLKFTRAIGDYLPAESWVLTYSIVADGHSQSWSTTDNGDGSHLSNVTAATTATWTPAVYVWQGFVTKTTERYTIGTGTIAVLANYATLSDGQDTRSHAKRSLDLIEAAIEGTIPDAVSSYSIGGRQISKMTGDELRSWRNYYGARYAQEQRLERTARGLSHNGIIQVRF